MNAGELISQVEAVPGARVAAPQYGKLINRAVRPTYAIDKYMANADRSAFPKKNVLHLADGYDVLWVNGAWAGIEFDVQVVKVRAVTVKLFLGKVIVGHLLLRQYKNAAGHPMFLDDFHVHCDDASQEGEELGNAAVMLIDLIGYEDDYTLAAGDIVTEVAMLNVGESCRNKLIWADAILGLVAHYSRVSNIFVLKAFPLEFMWAVDSTKRAQWNNQPASFGLDTDAGLARVDRRTRALQKLYEKHLGFAPVCKSGNAVWMGKYV